MGRRWGKVRQRVPGMKGRTGNRGNYVEQEGRLVEGKVGWGIEVEKGLGGVRLGTTEGKLGEGTSLIDGGARIERWP